MKPDVDVLILGGGCSGLSLAVALAAQAPDLRVVTVERRERYTRDRTWCFWNTTSHPFGPAVTHEWDRWRVSSAGEVATQTSRRFRYQHLPADRFYTLAQELLAKPGHAGADTLLLNTDANETVREGALLRTDTSAGSIRSRWVFDARTMPVQSARPVFWQRFLGWHVQTEHPCFDPACVGLMDFKSSQIPGRIAFVYTLPFSQCEALVEVTYLDRAELEPADAHKHLAEHLCELTHGKAYRVLFEEAGMLPMGDRRSAEPPSATVIPVGTRGGRVKPSSGYAFQRIQRQSTEIARALQQGAALPRQWEPRVYDWLDRVFLRALSRHPERAATYFLQLFQRVSPDLLIPFLSESAGAHAIASAMLALPVRDFACAAFLPHQRSVQ